MLGHNLFEVSQVCLENHVELRISYTLSIHNVLHTCWLLASWHLERVVQGKAILVRADHNWLDIRLNLQDLALPSLQSLKELLNVILNFVWLNSFRIPCQIPAYITLYFICLLNTFILYYMHFFCTINWVLFFLKVSVGAATLPWTDVTTT